MNVRLRNNIVVQGEGEMTLLFAHGFGCDQSMWRLTEPAFRDRYRTVVFDLVGNGRSDLASYDAVKYASLHGYASDVIEIAASVADTPIVFVGHSVSAVIGLLAANQVPGMFIGQVMVCPSPSYIDDGDYIGGFSQEDIDGLLDTLDDNYLGWSASMAPVIMGAPDQPELSDELVNSFCRTDPEISQKFARVTFLSDHRDDVLKCTVPTLILECTDDIIAPRSVGQFMHESMPGSTLVAIENVGHCPQLSAPGPTNAAIDAFLAGLAR
ncbi:MAG: alpha/beta hydrolase [Gemmatimonadales bacterium]|nr:alpha/beta hydrolase [Gemmatimonadales bacterium]